ncbi:type VI secretion system membrane subunit TssM [Methylobacterium nodulans]|uniref:Type VI secretion protein IcmF n=1 Tax=Methylobacterium nodulans (strain LMG 21967 / CNCM I-2342 / ORS 2060) TaxID=460265 RepID=B8IIC0_METNO|nr:type VI secretion system membrane subunit TssM [Methylobacterium nodulans]ACL57989.1 type VI secretion protein IcmF [Methylobacterium nodulans ORS 2060]
MITLPRSRPLWLGLLATLAGSAALAALVWWAGPLVAFGTARPLEGDLPRAALAAAILLAGLATCGLRLRRHRRSVAALEAEISRDEGDGAVLGATMRDALATLRKVGSPKGDPLYELPWYVIIGPPGAGKTTALVNSGLKFPLAREGAAAAVAGAGGTRYCDWWFAEEAVLIDTAGRYTTQDSDPRGDRESWLAFLDLLKRHRPRQPINGVLVAISLEDLIAGPPEAVAAHASAVRKRLLELHERLGVDFPVYALFTKADLIAGFAEFFGHLPEAGRRMVWGHTFQTGERTRNMVGSVAAEFDALVERTNAWLPDRLQEEPNPTSRVVLFGFPSQVASLKDLVVDFLTAVFEPTRYHAAAALRGFYFVSGTQQGTPIDRLIGALSRSFGSQDAAPDAAPGLGRSFFLADLLRKVVIAEAGWVSTNRAALRRLLALRAGAYAGLALAAALAVGLWWTSFLRNEALSGQAAAGAAKYRAEAVDVLRDSVVADRNFSKVLPYLNTLRYLPAGYASRGEAGPVLATFGLSQRARLGSAAETAYHAGLERLLRPRLIYRLEELIEANRGNPGVLYEALKVYLMIGRRPEAPLDRDLVLAWMRRDWAEFLYSGAGFAKGRQLLEDHLVAMLDLEDAGEPVVSINQGLVEETQRTLARLSVAERAYELLKSEARASGRRDWTLAAAAGPDAALVFEATGRGDLDGVRVPYFLTYDGFFDAFIDRFGDIAEAVGRDRWVLGGAGEEEAYTAQYGSLFADLLKLYARDFAAAWRSTLGRLKLRPLAADRPRYVALTALAAPTSPLKRLLESVGAETRLTRERPAARPGTEADPRATKAAAVVAGALSAEAERQAAGVLPSRVASTASALGRLALERTPPQAAGPARIDASEAPGAAIEAGFRAFHAVLDGEGGKRAVDALLANLSDLRAAALEAAAPGGATAPLSAQARNLRSLASRFPAPFEAMIQGAAAEFEGSVTGAAVAGLAQGLAETVTRECQAAVAGRYPFARSEREIPLADFARLFAPGGILDRFFTQNLVSHVDRSRPQWTWRADDQVARAFSLATLREFQRAAEIRDAFFAAGGTTPGFTLAVTPLALTGDATRAKFELNGSTVEAGTGVNAPASLAWPGASGLGRAAVSVEGIFGTNAASVERAGAWALYRLLEAGSLLRQGDAVVATFSLGGRDVSYRLAVSAIANPLTLPALREFRCPSSL